MAKPNPGKVDPGIARSAMANANGKVSAMWSQYIREHWRLTGDLAPGCDKKDFDAWLRQNGFAAV